VKRGEVKVNLGLEISEGCEDEGPKHYYLEREDGVFKFESGTLEQALSSNYRVIISASSWKGAEDVLDKARFLDLALEEVQSAFPQFFPLPSYLAIVNDDRSWHGPSFYFDTVGDFEYPSAKEWQRDGKKYRALAKAIGSKFFDSPPEGIKARKGYEFKNGKQVRQKPVGLQDINNTLVNLREACLSCFTFSGKWHATRADANKPVEELIGLIQLVYRTNPKDLMGYHFQIDGVLKEVTAKGVEKALRGDEAKKKREGLIKVLRVLTTLKSKVKKNETKTTSSENDDEELP
jgi:hypothetical protein